MRISKKVITGMFRRGNTFYWTVVTTGPEGPVYSAPQSGVLELDDAAAADPKAMAAQFRKQFPTLTGSIAFALPTERMLIRIMALPPCNAEEMDSMIRLQMDKISPFPDGHIAIAYETLDDSETRRLTLMAGVHKEAVDFIGAFCSNAGLDLRRLDAEPAVWWSVIRDYINNHRDSLAGRRIFGVLEAGRILLITTQNGQPLSFNLVRFPEEQSPEECAGELAQEIRNLSLALDIEHGPEPIAARRVWADTVSAGGGDASDKPVWHDILANTLNCQVEITPLSDLPPLSAAITKRMVAPPFQPHVLPQGKKAVMDFIPEAWRTAAAARMLKRKLLLLTAAILAIWVVGIAAFFGGYRLEKIRNDRLDALMQKLKEPAENVRVLQRKLRSFEQSLARNRMALEALREVSSRLPTGANITYFNFKRGRSVILRGEAETVEPIYDFKQALDEADLFDQVEMGSIQPGKRREITVQTFQMNARFPESPK